MNRTSFTLIEMLAVIVIATLVVSVAGMNISATSTTTAFIRTVAMLQQMDARGRLHARTGAEPIAMVINPESKSVRLVGLTSEAPLALAQIPANIELNVEISATRGTRPDGGFTVVFDPRGISDDYVIIVRSATRAQQLDVAGLTGDVQLQEVAPR